MTDAPTAKHPMKPEGHCAHCGGLLPGTADSIFVPFAQRARDRSGLGLGLSIARQSVEADFGTLTVKDVPGNGCILTICLPRHPLH